MLKFATIALLLLFTYGCSWPKKTQGRILNASLSTTKHVLFDSSNEKKATDLRKRINRKKRDYKYAKKWHGQSAANSHKRDLIKLEKELAKYE